MDSYKFAFSLYLTRGRARGAYDQILRVVIYTKGITAKNLLKTAISLRAFNSKLSSLGSTTWWGDVKEDVGLNIWTKCNYTKEGLVPFSKYSNRLEYLLSGINSKYYSVLYKLRTWLKDLSGVALPQ